MHPRLRFFRPFLLSALAISSAATAACGDPEVSGPGDAMVGDAGVDADPNGPEAPAPPAIGPCADGFREVADGGGTTTCDPFPEAGQATCTGAEAHFVGTPGCTLLGSECPADGLPTDLPTDLPPGATVHFVLAGGAGGDGTRGRPYPRINDAVRVASAGDIIAVGRGTYDESLSIPAEVTVIGACVAETILAPTFLPGTASVSTSSAGAVVQNLTVASAVRRGVGAAGRGASLTVEDVLIDGAVGMGLTVGEGASMTARRVVIRDTRFEDGVGAGIILGSGSFSADLVSVERAPDFGLYAFDDDVMATLDRVTITGTTEQPGGPAFGVWAEDGAALMFTRSIIEQNAGAGLYAKGAGTTVAFTDSTIRDNQPTAAGRYGRGLNFEGGAQGSLDRCVVSGNSNVGVYIDGATVGLSDAVVRDTRVEVATQRGGRGFEVIGATAVLTLDRTLVEEASEAAVLVTAGAQLEARDVTIRGTRPRALDGALGGGLWLQQGAAAHIERVLLEQNKWVGVSVFDGSTLTGTDLVVRDTSALTTGRLEGRGIDIEGGAAVTLERVLLENNGGFGAYASSGSTLTLSQAEVRGTLPEETTGRGGRGINYQQDSSGSLRDVRVVDNHEVGVAIVEGAGPVVLENVQILGVSERPCADTSCTTTPFGVGLFVGGSVARATGVEIVDAELCGVQLANDAELDLVGGRVAGSAIGVCLQVPGYDVNRITDGVAYEDNGTNLDSTMLPVPEPGVSSIVE